MLPMSCLTIRLPARPQDNESQRAEWTAVAVSMNSHCRRSAHEGTVDIFVASILTVSYIVYLHKRCTNQSFSMYCKYVRRSVLPYTVHHCMRLFWCVKRPQCAKQDRDDLIDVLPILLADLRLCTYMLHTICKDSKDGFVHMIKSYDCCKYPYQRRCDMPHVFFSRIDVPIPIV